jgi:acyl carrier protein
MKDVKQQIRSYILDNFLMGGDRDGLKDGDSFLEQRILDSTGFIELVSYIEQQFGVKVEDEEIVPENFDSVNNIAAYLQNKSSA